MRINSIKSDQLFKWSDIYETQVNSCFTPKTKNSFTQASAYRGRFARLINRALQALWQAGMQMCRWAGSRSKVLSLGKQAWQQAADGLCPTRFKAKGRRILSKLSQNKDNLRRTLRNQPRAFASQGKVLARPPPKVRDR